MITLDDYIGATIDDLAAFYDSLEPKKKKNINSIDDAILLEKEETAALEGGEQE